MSDAITRWLQLPLPVKAGTLAGSVLLLILLAWLLLLRPQLQAQQQLQQKLAGLKQRAQQRQLQLNQHPALSMLLQQQQHIEAQLATSTNSGSLEALLAARGDQLASWQPDGEPKQLSLSLSWREFQPLFSHLQTLQPTPLPARFLLQAEKDRLLAQLWLEVNDEE